MSDGSASIPVLECSNASDDQESAFSFLTGSKTKSATKLSAFLAAHGCPLSAQEMQPSHLTVQSYCYLVYFLIKLIDPQYPSITGKTAVRRPPPHPLIPLTPAAGSEKEVSVDVLRLLSVLGCPAMGEVKAALHGSADSQSAFLSSLTWLMDTVTSHQASSSSAHSSADATAAFIQSTYRLHALGQGYQAAETEAAFLQHMSDSNADLEDEVERISMLNSLGEYEAVLIGQQGGRVHELKQRKQERAKAIHSMKRRLHQRKQDVGEVRRDVEDVQGQLSSLQRDIAQQRRTNGLVQQKQVRAQGWASLDDYHVLFAEHQQLECKYSNMVAIRQQLQELIGDVGLLGSDQLTRLQQKAIRYNTIVEQVHQMLSTCPLMAEHALVQDKSSYAIDLLQQQREVIIAVDGQQQDDAVRQVLLPKLHALSNVSTFVSFTYCC